MLYIIKTYNALGKLVETSTAQHELEAVTMAYSWVRDRWGWTAHIIKDGTMHGLYIARDDDFSRRGCISLEHAARLLEETNWTGRLSPKDILREGRY